MSRRIIMTGAALAALALPAVGQFTQHRSGFQPGITDPVDSILARRITMTTLGRQNDQVHDIIDGPGAAEEEAARMRLDNIGVFLLGIPEMFPQGSYIYSKELEENDPSRVTSALPSLWENWDDFYTRALVASETAYRAGRASTWEELVSLTEDLEGQCESCHNDYRQNPAPIEFGAPPAAPAPPTP
jgi:hypothetical protein